MAQHTDWSQESSQESCIHEYEEGETTGVNICKLCGKGREAATVFAEDRPFALSGPNEGRLIGENLRPDQNDFTHSESYYTYKKLQEIRRLGSEMRIPSHLIKGSENLYKSIRKRRYVKSAHSNSLSTYITCRNDTNNELMFIDFLEKLDLERRQLSKPFFRKQKSDIQYRDENDHPNRICVIERTNLSQVMLDRFYSALFPNDRTEGKQTILKDSKIIYDRMEKNWIALGRNPRGLYGATLLISCKMHGHDISIKEVADTVRMSESTIRKRLMELKNTPGTDQSVADYLNAPIEEWQTNHLPPCMSSTHGVVSEDPDSHATSPESLSDFSYSIHGLHDSGDEVSLCSDDELDVERYILSREESEHKTKIWEEMFSDYRPKSKTTSKTPFTAEKYHTIPELFPRQSSSNSSQSQSHEHTHRTPEKRVKRKMPPPGNTRITDFFTRVTSSQEVDSLTSDLVSPLSYESQPPLPEEDHAPIHPFSTPVQTFTQVPQSHPYMTPPYSEDGDSLDISLTDNDPNFLFLRDSPTFEDPLNLQSGDNN